MKRTIILLLMTLFSLSHGRALTLTQAKRANPEISRLLRMAHGQQRKWIQFLLIDMPTIDLVTLDADSMLADIAALDSALGIVPWTDDIPHEYFLRYVLPYRASQEPLEYFRKNHTGELLERVSDCEDIECAAERINEWAYEEMKYEPTSRWDQTAEQTLVRGIGRCEEMAILYVKACRAVGIPIRKAYTPYWPFCNSNHAWVEVWTGDSWQFVGGAEMTALGNAWFKKSSSRTTIIKGIAWGEMDSADVPIYRAKDGYTILNLMPLYSDTTGLTVTVLDSLSEPVESVDVWLSVFNYSSLRAVARHKTDNTGVAHFVIGKAEAFVSAGKDSLWNFAIVPFEDGDNTTSLTLNLSRTAIPDTLFWLHVRHEVLAQKDTSYKPPDISYVRHDLKLERLTALDKTIVSRLPDSTVGTRLLKCLNRARGNRGELLKFWDAHPEERENILDFWEAMHIKDILLPDSSLWETLWRQSQDMLDRAETRNIPDSLFWEYVANPRILWENFANWYPEIWEAFGSYKELAAQDIADMLKHRELVRIDTLRDMSYFGGLMNPAQVLRARTGGNIERLGVFVSVMRVFGIPARIAWDYNAAEYFDGDDWQRFELKDEKETEPRKTGIVKAVFTDGEPQTELEFYEDFTIAEMQDGMFNDITPPMDSLDSFLVFSDIPVGDYCFFTGWRAAYGDPFVRMLPFAVEDGTTSVTVPIGLPPVEMVAPGDLLVRKFKSIKPGDIRDTRGRILDEDDWQSGTFIFAFFDTEHESSISTAMRLAHVEEIPMLLFIETESRLDAGKFCSENELSGRIFHGTRKELKRILGFGKLPSILLLDDGEAIMWTEGLNLNVDKLINSLIKY